MFKLDQRIGILGGGQLGKMLCQAAADWHLHIAVLDPTPEAPASHLCHRFVVGDFRDYETVLSFGQQVDLITIEIEQVNVQALYALEQSGKVVHPSAKAVEIIQDKGKQKIFYAENGIPTPAFELFESEQSLLEAVHSARWRLPLVQKTRVAGYDGRGVAILRTPEDLDTKLLRGPCLAEEFVSVRAELAVIAARNTFDEVVVFPPVEMDFHAEANLVEMLLCPARISPIEAAEAEAIAERVIRAFDLCGLLAVEMFLTQDRRILVNEVAPRPHNSGHHTIEAAVTSQFQQHLRAICGLPLGDTSLRTPAGMLNILGAPDHNGPPHYTGIEQLLAEPGVYLHLYGKQRTAPFRKMGHITITAPTIEEVVNKAHRIRHVIEVTSRPQKT
ncbi:MAG: 5-(carboxyamino)imidazole ribonucleotide synthase [Saprospiraceae bacterium]|nr:5-(carboxyamino)imidazole ribonucleotide synthase [Saprospiraceae bacterium]MDW8482970.1 5-(carboxyamino)imidazole ribonucleotide synthase [Saprospiraceae bacterium]